MQNRNHDYYMQLALKQASMAEEQGEVPTGCIIVTMPEGPDAAAGHVIGRAHNQVELLKDPTAHAEMLAITQAAASTGDWRLTNTVLYVTKEPCVMCAGAIILARIPVVVFGTPDPKRGGAVSLFKVLNNDNLNHKCQIVSGVMEMECRSILQNFFAKQREKNR